MCWDEQGCEMNQIVQNENLCLTEEQDHYLLTLYPPFSPDIYQEVKCACKHASGCKRVVINLSGTRYLDSTGMGVLLLIRTELSGKISKISVAGLSCDMQRLFLVSHFSEFFTIESMPIEVNSGQFEELSEKILYLLANYSNGDTKAEMQEVLRLIYLLQVYQMELEMQNEELRQTQVALQQSQKDLQDAYEMSDFGFLTLDTSNTIIKTNLTMTAMLNINRDDLIDHRITDFISPPDQDTFYFFRLQALKSQVLESCELNLLKSDGSHVAVRLQCEGLNGVNNGDVKKLKILVRPRSFQHLPDLN
uniref:Anti-sigma factor antagonist n=1 Tax=Magnetococcus massalia (strain MO-1) TaxID=451514 RepID=A0A1S7LEE1_MAGMO|nr:protein of unknown function [Candidatus Magnetococcus massalia]